MSNKANIISKVWSFAGVLRDDGFMTTEQMFIIP